MDEENSSSAAISALRAGQGRSAPDDLEQVRAALDSARGGDGAAPGPTRFLTALAVLRQLREHIAAWEPELIDAARARGASWAELAPALGVASRQAAERRALRLRPAGDAAASTGDQRVQAERDKRAGQRAVNAWARENAADLRRLAGQVSALTDLPRDAGPALDALRAALGHDDAAALPGPLMESLPRVAPAHPALAREIEAVGLSTHALRRDTSNNRRRTPDQPVGGR